MNPLLRALRLPLVTLSLALATTAALADDAAPAGAKAAPAKVSAKKASSKAPAAGKVTYIDMGPILGRRQQPMASVDLAERQLSMPLPELRPDFAEKIAGATVASPF